MGWRTGGTHTPVSDDYRIFGISFIINISTLSLVGVLGVG